MMDVPGERRASIISAQFEHRIALLSVAVLSRIRKMKIANLRKFQALVQNLLPFVSTQVDYRIVLEIAYHQEVGEDFSLKQLLLSEVGPPATVRRRLERLVGLRVIGKRSGGGDGRFVWLTVEKEPMRRLLQVARAVEMKRGTSTAAGAASR